jgi:hypothetical protein
VDNPGKGTAKTICVLQGQTRPQDPSPRIDPEQHCPLLDLAEEESTMGSERAARKRQPDLEDD